jgi:glutamate/tyrosine decarboxylase-like PLP-dependent enzyme
VQAKYAPLSPDKRVDVSEIEKLITRNTVILSASAPCIPYCVIDPVEELAGTKGYRQPGDERLFVHLGPT